MGDRDDMKRRAATAALEHVRGRDVIGVGTGTTAEAFVDALAAEAVPLRGAVASSEATARRLREVGIPVLSLDAVEELPLYVDGADEVDGGLRLNKGRAGALTREKVLAAASRTFVCLVDEGKLVERLGAVPVAVEVLPMAAGFVARELRSRWGAETDRRDGFLSDNGNVLLDVAGLPVAEDPPRLEAELDAMPGVVENGIFALRPADVLVVGCHHGEQVLGKT